MINHSFIFLDRVTEDSEQKLWLQGIHTWDAFLSESSISGFSRVRKLHANRLLRQYGRLYHQRDVLGLSQFIPQSEHWRLYDLLRGGVLALDIETSGYYGDITVIGLHDGEHAQFFVKGKNLEEYGLRLALEQATALLTFNGSSFDIPVIERRFPHLGPLLRSKIHIDLRHVAARVGYSGGLKAIEKELRIGREGAIQGMSGDQAVVLWQRFEETGDENALRLLLAYNEADIANLFPLAEQVIPERWTLQRSMPKSTNRTEA